MAFARVFQVGNNQVVSLPKDLRLTTETVDVFRRGDELVMREVALNASAIFDTLASLPADFMEDGRGDTPPQDRDGR